MVIRAHGLWFEVRVLDGERADDILIATVRGLLKRKRRGTDVVAVGDDVWVTFLPDNEAAIEAIAPRTRSLVRTARNTRDTEQVILANIDQVMFAFAVADPEPHLRMLDRFIVLAELQQIPVEIIVTKTDLDAQSSTSSRDRFRRYEGLYPLHFVSVKTGDGLEELRNSLTGKLSAIAGPSGVGKSSLLNAIDPDHEREIRDVSESTGKGRHTTIGSRVYEISPGTFVADTPGMRSLAMHSVDPLRLPDCFIEFRPFLGDCAFRDCTHVHEPDCAIRSAVERGDIGRERYESYVSLRIGREEE